MARKYRPKRVARNKYGRRIAIGDIHGCYFAFKKLLEKLKLTKNDQIFLLGDLIDKGRDSSKVLDIVIELKENDYQIFPIKGNHEEKLFLAYNCGFDFFEKYLEEYNSQGLLCDKLEEYLELIYNFDYCIELDNFVLSHAGINEGRINPFTDLRGMFPKIDFQFNEADFLNKIQVHGHLMRSKTEIKRNIEERKKRFSIDSGCYLNEGEFGYLTAIELDVMELFHQKNQ